MTNWTCFVYLKISVGLYCLIPTFQSSVTIFPKSYLTHEPAGRYRPSTRYGQAPAVALILRPWKQTIPKGFRMKISMKLFYQYIAIFFNISPTSKHFHPLQVENCDSNSRLVVDENDNVKSGLKGLRHMGEQSTLRVLGIFDYALQ